MFLGLFELGNRHQADNRSAGDRGAFLMHTALEKELDGLLEALLGVPIVGLRR